MIDSLNLNFDGASSMENYLGLPSDLSPEIREAVAKVKALVEKYRTQAIHKPFSWATVDSENQVGEEIRKITAACPPGTIGTFGVGIPTVEIHQYKGFVIAIKAVRKPNGHYSTLSGVRKSGTRTPHEAFPLADEEF